MAVVNDDPGYTQLTKLNIQESLLIDGHPVTAGIEDVSVTEDYTQTKHDDGIFCDATAGNFTVTMIDPALALKRRVAVKNETGALSTITIAPTTGTVEVTSLSDTQSVILAPRAGAWVSV